MISRVPYEQIEGWLLALTEWKSRLAEMKEQLNHIPGLAQKFEQVAIYGKGHKNEAILHEVIRRLQLRETEIPLLELKIQVLEGAIRSLQPDEQQFIADRYGNRLPNADAMEKLGVSSKTYYGKRKRILERIYCFVGGDNSIIGLHDEPFWENS